jgi:hypothetical protein
MRHGIGAKNGSRCGAGRLSAAKSLATRKTCSSAKSAAHKSKFDPDVRWPISYCSASGASTRVKTAGSGTHSSQKALASRSSFSGSIVSEILKEHRAPQWSDHYANVCRKMFESIPLILNIKDLLDMP